MKQELDETDPPVAHMDTPALLAFVFVWMIAGVFLVVCLLNLQGFDNLILWLGGGYCAIVFWPEAAGKAKSFLILSKFRLQLRKYRNDQTK